MTKYPFRSELLNFHPNAVSNFDFLMYILDMVKCRWNKAQLAAYRFVVSLVTSDRGEY